MIITLIATLTFILQFSLEDEDIANSIDTPLGMIESFTIIYFTFEYVLRFSCSPNKWRFFKHPINLVDLFAILPIYLTFALDFKLYNWIHFSKKVYRMEETSLPSAESRLKSNSFEVN